MIVMITVCDNGDDGNENNNADDHNQVETLLKFNPNKRLTAHAALRHPYVQRFLIIIISFIIIIDDFDFDMSRGSSLS